MDPNLNRTEQEKMADRELDGLEARLDNRPTTRKIMQNKAVNLSELLRLRNCVDDAEATGPGHNKISGSFRPASKARDKWFDAK